jgi:cobalt transporter subunit CbtB
MISRSVSGAGVESSKVETLKAALIALFLGFGLVYLAGFSATAGVHDAAHDARHALSFPCH